MNAVPQTPKILQKIKNCYLFLGKEKDQLTEHLSKFKLNPVQEFIDTIFDHFFAYFMKIFTPKKVEGRAKNYCTVLNSFRFWYLRNAGSGSKDGGS